MNKENPSRVEPRAWVPHQYQQKAIEFLLDNGSGQLWLDPG